MEIILYIVTFQERHFKTYLVMGISKEHAKFALFTMFIIDRIVNDNKNYQEYDPLIIDEIQRHCSINRVRNKYLTVLQALKNTMVSLL